MTGQFPILKEDGYYNSEAFNTNDGPVATRAYNYRYGFDVLYNVKAYDF